MLGIRSLAKALGGAGAGRALSTLCELAAASRWTNPALLAPLACQASSNSALGLPWAAASTALQQPASLSHGLAAAGVLAQQQPLPAAGGLWAPHQDGLLRQTEEWRMDSVRRKRKRAMNRHKHRKRRKLNRMRK